MDYTLWKPQLAQLKGGPPFRPVEGGLQGVHTSQDEQLDLFPAARRALMTLADNNVPIAIASSTKFDAWARELFSLIKIDEQRTIADVVRAPIVIRPGSKVHHFKSIAAQTGTPMTQTLFFDNEHGNVAEAERLGLTSVPCSDGMTDHVFAEALIRHAGRARSESTGRLDSRSHTRDSLRSQTHDNADSLLQGIRSSVPWKAPPLKHADQTGVIGFEVQFISGWMQPKNLTSQQMKKISFLLSWALVHLPDLLTPRRHAHTPPSM